MNRIACLASSALATPAATVSFPILCGLWLLLGGSVNGLTLVLSVFAITTTQLVLSAQSRDTAALQTKVDGLVRASDADDALIGIERT